MEVILMRDLTECFDSMFFKTLSGLLSIHNFGLDSQMFEMCSVRERSFLNYIRRLVLRYRYLDGNGQKMEYFKDYDDFDFEGFESMFFKEENNQNLDENKKIEKGGDTENKSQNIGDLSDEKGKQNLNLSEKSKPGFYYQ